MSGKRRRPWIVRVTTGYDIDAETGTFKQKQETLGYAATRAEGVQMLIYTDLRISELLELKKRTSI